MSTIKKKARLSKAMKPATEPLLKASDVEEDIRSTSPTTFNLTERSDMTTMEAKAAPPASLEAQNFLLPGDTGSPPVSALIQSPKEEVVTNDRGKAPMLFTTETARVSPPSPNDCCKWFPTKSDLGAYKSDDPSKAPDGSLIHTLYMQLWVAGDKGMTLKELLESFKTHKSWHSFGSDWEHEVRFHLQNNPHFEEVKEYQLLSDRQPGLQQQPKLSANVKCMGPMVAPVTAVELELALRTLQLDIQDRALLPTVITHPKGLRTRRNACQKETKAAVWTQSATKLEKSHIQVHKHVPRLARPSNTQQATGTPLPKSSMKQKSSSDQDRLPLPICGSSKKQQAQAFAKQWETMTRMPSLPCSRKDVPKKRNCPLNARKLSEHQSSKDAEKRARYSTDEAQMIATFNSKGYTGLLASQMHSMGLPGMPAQQLVEPKRISLAGAVTPVRCVKSEVDDNLVQPAHSHPSGHSKGNVNPGGGFDVPKRVEPGMELRVVTTASNRQFLIATKTPASVVAETTVDGRPKATPVIRPRTIPPLPPPHGIPGKTQKTRSLQSL